MKPRKIFCAGLALLPLAGCMSLPEHHVGHERLLGAFVSTDQQLYLLGSLRSARFDAAPFHAYKQVVDGPLRDALVCTRMNYRIDAKGTQNSNTVQARYAMLFAADKVSPVLAAQFALQPLAVDAAAIAAGTETLPENYQLAADPACALPASGGRYYTLLLQGVGTWLPIQQHRELVGIASFPQPLEARLEVYRHPGLLYNPLSVPVGVVGAPVLLLSIPFLGPEHWK